MIGASDIDEQGASLSVPEPPARWTTDTARHLQFCCWLVACALHIARKRCVSTGSNRESCTEGCPIGRSAGQWLVGRGKRLIALMARDG